MIDKCRLCGADILWARSWKNKRWMPLDVVRVSRGVRFVVAGGGIAYLENTGQGHEPHFATCEKRKKAEEMDVDQGEMDV